MYRDSKYTSLWETLTIVLIIFIIVLVCIQSKQTNDSLSRLCREKFGKDYSWQETDQIQRGYCIGDNGDTKRLKNEEMNKYLSGKYK